MESKSAKRKLAAARSFLGTCEFSEAKKFTIYEIYEFFADRYLNKNLGCDYLQLCAIICLLRIKGAYFFHRALTRSKLFLLILLIIPIISP